MAFLTDTLGLLTGYIVPFVLVLSLIVFVHEMGHYLVGRWCGIRVVAFSLGFGPELLGFNDRNGTRWKLSLLPLGGYVRFYGDEDASSKPDHGRLAGMSEAEREQSFPGARLWKRAATVAAGPIANFILAIAIFTVLYSIYGKPVSDPVVAEVTPGSAAEAAGLKPGDLILSIDGVEIDTFDELRQYVAMRPETSITVTIRRDGASLDVPMVPQRLETKDQFGNKMELGRIGVASNQDVGNFRTETFTPLQAMGEGVQSCIEIVTGTGRYIGNIFAGRMKADQLGGPIRGAQASGQMASLGFAALLALAAVLSVSVGLLNLLPVPVLDGGHLMFYALEAIRGKPVGEAVQEIAFKVGLAMVMSLMVFATWNDLGIFAG